MPRKGESIYKRKDGRWEARYIDHYEDGTAKYRFIYARTYLEVKRKRNEAIKNSKSPARARTVNKSVSIGVISAWWLDQKKNQVKESTYTRYERIVRVYLLPAIGQLSVTQVNSEVIRSFLEGLYVSGKAGGCPLGPKSVADIWCVLKAILVYAKSKGLTEIDISGMLISRTSTARTQPSQSARAAQSSIVTSEHQQRLEAVLWNTSDSIKSSDSVNLGVLLALYTGMRIGEICGLKWDDIDMCSGTLSVCRTVERITDLCESTPQKTKVIISEPKTINAVRTIPIPSYLLNYLSRFSFPGEHYILSNAPHPMEPHQFYMKYKALLSSCGIPPYTFHALRHTFATKCMEQGFDVKALSEILGHSNIRTTLSLYVHPTLEQKRCQMERLNPHRQL